MEISIGVDEYRKLREFPSSPLPDDLQNWFEAAKLTMSLPNTRVFFIENQVAKEFSNGVLVHIGALGSAYPDDDCFAFIESDESRESDKNTIIHEMVHLLGIGHTTTNHDLYEAEVNKFSVATEKNLAVLLVRRIASDMRKD